MPQRQLGPHLCGGDGNHRLRHQLFPDPAYFATLETDADYINYRVYATHDIHHILSGFSLDNLGETGVISISVGQFNHPGLGFVDLIDLLLQFLLNETPFDEATSAKQQAHTAGYVFHMIGHGLEMAAQAKPLFPVLWEQRFEQDLEELRHELGIKAVREGPSAGTPIQRLQPL